MAYSPFQYLGRIAKSLYTRNALSMKEYLTGLTEAGFLAGSLVLGITIADRCSTDYRPSRIPSNQTETDADGLFDQFPVSIPGARSITKYGVRGSSHCLVHIRQTHFLNRGAWMNAMKSRYNMAEDKIKENIDAMELREDESFAVLKDVAVILSYLRERLSLTAVYPEGVDVEDAKFINEMLADIRKKYLETGDSIFEDAKTQIGEELAEGLFYDIKTTGDGSLEVRVTESDEIREESADTFMDAILDKGGDWEPSNVRREDFLLERVSSDQERLAVTTFGGLHDWRDNVDSWNERHPEDTFSLIEVVPMSYRSKD